MTSTIVWHCLPNESEDERDWRLTKDLHRIFFDSKPCNEICPENYLEPTHDIICSICGARADDARDIKHSTPPFMESLDAMRLIVESGRFAEVREEYFHWNPSGAKYLCRVLLYRNQNPNMDYSFQGASYNSRQEAFYVAALRSLGYL